MTKILLN